MDGDPRVTEKLVGTPGGMFGEFLNFLATIEEVLATNLREKDVAELLTQFISGFMKQETFDYCNLTQTEQTQLLQIINKKGAEQDKSGGEAG